MLLVTDQFAKRIPAFSLVPQILVLCMSGSQKQATVSRYVKKKRATCFVRACRILNVQIEKLFGAHILLEALNVDLNYPFILNIVHSYLTYVLTQRIYTLHIPFRFWGYLERVSFHISAGFSCFLFRSRTSRAHVYPLLYKAQNRQANEYCGRVWGETLVTTWPGSVRPLDRAMPIP